MRSVTVKRITALLLAVFLLAAMPAAADPPDDGVGMNICGFTSRTFDGEPVDGSIFDEAELTVINIWQRWCGPCWSEMPGFQQLYDYYLETPGEDVHVWGALYYDNSANIQEAIDFVAEHGYNWPMMLVCDEFISVATGGNPEEYCHIPQTFIVDRYGTVRAQVVGSIEQEPLFELVDSWLGVLRDEYAANAGDVDCNGQRTFADVSLLYQYCIGVAALGHDAMVNADVNRSSSVDFADVSSLYQLLLS